MSIPTYAPTALDFELPHPRRAEPPEPLFGPDGEMLYPDSDGRLMAENTLQADWIHQIRSGLNRIYRDDPDVFVAHDLLWYPVEGRNTRRLSPDVMVAFGRPKEYRGSYMQFKEGGIPPQVAFEIWSPGNRRRALAYKFRFYERYGVEEYYHFDPYKIRLDAWIRDGETLRPIAETDGWVSPRMGIRFEIRNDLTIYAPDGRPFLSDDDRSRRQDEHERIARVEAERADAEGRRADAADRQARAEAERADAANRQARAEAERADAANRQARAEAERADAEAGRAERLAARLRELGIDPDEIPPG